MLKKLYKANSTLQGGTVLQEALQFHRGNREKLALIYDKVLRFYKDLPSNFRLDLNSIFCDLETTAKQKRSELASPECYILVAGKLYTYPPSSFNICIPVLYIQIRQKCCLIKSVKFKKNDKNRFVT